MINASQYVLSGLFLQDLASCHPYQALIFETLPNAKMFRQNIHTQMLQYNVSTIRDLGLDITPHGNIMQHINKHTHTLLVLDTLSVALFMDILPHITSNLTIINCNTGISSIGTKLQPEYNDIVTMMHTQWIINTYEPFDITSILHILQEESKGITYIRLASKDYPHSLTKNDETPMTQSSIITPQQLNPIIDLTSAINPGTNPVATIFCGGSILPEAIQACNTLADQHIETDIFILLDWSIFMGQKHYTLETVQHHLTMTKKLIIVCDQEKKETLFQYFQQFLKKQNIQADISLVTPYIANISTTLADYIYEQGQFDGDHLAARIKKLLGR